MVPLPSSLYNPYSITRMEVSLEEHYTHVPKFILLKVTFGFIVSSEKNYIIIYFYTKYFNCCLNEHDR